jgi:hypothetical protein
MKVNVKTKVEAKKRSIKLMATIAILVLCVAVDFFCFQELFGNDDVLALWQAMGLAVFFGIAVNLLSYICANWGVGSLLDINHLRKNAREEQKDIIKAETSRMKKTSIIVLSVALSCALAGQSYLTFTRLQTLKQNEKTHAERHSAWQAEKGTGDFRAQQLHTRNEPTHTPLPDQAMLVFPLFTTIVSFAVGLKFRKEYNKFEDDYNDACAEIEGIRNEFLDKYQPLEFQKNASIDGYRNEISSLLISAHEIIAELESESESTGLEDMLNKYIYSDSKSDSKDSIDVGKYRIQLEKKLKAKSPELFEMHITQLVTSLKEMAGTIHRKLSDLSQDPSALISVTLEENIAPYNFPERVKKLEEVDTKFLTGGSNDKS